MTVQSLPLQPVHKSDIVVCHKSLEAVLAHPMVIGIAITEVPHVDMSVA